MRLSILSIFNIQIFNYLVILSVRFGCDILWIPAVTSHREKLKKKMRRFRLLLIAAMLVIGGANASAARQNVSEIKGTVLDKAGKLGLDVPVNRELFRRITEMEKAY